MVEQLAGRPTRSEREERTHARLVALGFAAPEDRLPFATTTHDGSAAVYRLDMMGGPDRILESEIFGQEDGPSFTTHHYHPDGLTERYEVLKGRGHLMCDRDIISLEEGIVVDVPPDVLHQVVVPQGGYLHLLIVMRNAGLYPLNHQHIPAIEHPRYNDIYPVSRP